MSIEAILALGSAQVLIAILARVSLGSWLSPGALFASFWVFAGVGAALLAALGFDGVVRPAAIAMILVFTVAVWIGDEIGQRWRVQCHAAKPRVMSLHELSRGGSIVMLLSLAAMFIPIRLVQEFGRTLTDVASVSGWIQLVADINVARYHEQYVEPLDVRLLLTGLYAASLIAGTLLSAAQTRRTILVAWLPTLTGVAISAVTTAKATFLLPFLMTVATYLALGVSRRRFSTWTDVLGVSGKLVVAGSLITCALVATMFVRYAEHNLGDLALIGERLSGYLIGHMTALSAWGELEGYFASRELSWGTYTFLGPYSIVVGAERVPGIYEVLVYNDHVGDSNVYTAFRGLITDFGVPGALFALVAFGAIAGRCFAQLRSGARGAVNLVVLSCFYLFTFWSHVVNVFAYNSIIAAVTVWLAFLVWRQGLQRPTDSKTVADRQQQAAK